MRMFDRELGYVRLAPAALSIACAAWTIVNIVTADYTGATVTIIFATIYLVIGTAMPWALPRPPRIRYRRPRIVVRRREVRYGSAAPIMMWNVYVGDKADTAYILAAFESAIVLANRVHANTPRRWTVERR